ncbi:hypothetical protein HOK31_10445, partial [Candidatus Poribacteria bacterium]|nr:hypothetical protein [Candidatus Poribacteria bacterium]
SVIARKGRKADVTRFEELLRGAADDPATVEAILAAAAAIATSIERQLPNAAQRITAAAAARAPRPLPDTAAADPYVERAPQP